jgi:hypothetical protein
MAPANLPSIFNATSADIEQLLAAQCHIGSKKFVFPEALTCADIQESQTDNVP